MSIDQEVLFISCTSGEFGFYRESLRSRFEQLGLQARIQEQFTPEGISTLLMLDQKVQKCTAMVHIVGETTGSFPEDKSREDFKRIYGHLPETEPHLFKDLKNCSFNLSYTQWEAFLAILHDKPLFIAVPAKSFQQGRTSQPDPKQAALQSSHLEQLRLLDHHPEGDPFPNIDALALNVITFIASEGIPLDSPFDRIKAIGSASLMNRRLHEVPFRDIDQRHDGLVRWAITSEENTSKERASAARLLTGPGGSGKTRLMAEVCDTLRQQYNWHTGFLPSGLSFVSSFQRIKKLIEQPPNKKPLLIVVDSAEGRMHEVKEILETMFTAGNRMRLVLVGRSDGEWWDRANRKNRLLRSFVENNGESDVVHMPTTLGTKAREQLFYDAAGLVHSRSQASR